MISSPTSSLPNACKPLSNVTRSCLVPCVQGGQTVKVPAAAFGIPFAGPVAPEPLGEFQTWIDQSSNPPVLRMRIGGEWTALYALETDGTVLLRAALALSADPTASSQVATKHYTDTLAGIAGTLTIRGTLDCSGAPNYPAASTGDVYIVSAAGKIGGASGVNVLYAAMLVCMDDAVASGTQADEGTHWSIVQGQNPAQVRNASTVGDAHLAQFDAGSGTQVKSNGIVLDTDAAMTANSDARVPSQKAVKTALGGKPLGNDVPGQGDTFLWDGTRASFHTAPVSGRNLLVNPAFDIWEEAVSYALSASVSNVHVADFWTVGTAPSAQKTAARGTGFANAYYALKIQRMPGSNDVSHLRIAQQFGREDALFLQGKPLTVSFDAMTGADCSLLNIMAGFIWGTGIDEPCQLPPVHSGPPTFATGTGSSLPDAQGRTALENVYANPLSAQLPPPGQVVRIVNKPITIPARWDPGPITELAMVIDIGPFSGQAGGDDSISITNVKLEIGNLATPFVRPVPEEESRRCERRYRTSFRTNLPPQPGGGIGTGEHRAPALRAGTATQSLGMVRFPAMRAAPAVRFYNPVRGAASSLASDYTAGGCTATTAQNVTATGFEITAAGNAATAPGNTLGVHWVADARL